MGMKSTVSQYTLLPFSLWLFKFECKFTKNEFLSLPLCSHWSLSLELLEGALLMVSVYKFHCLY